jgi:hypothetical protein
MTGQAQSSVVKAIAQYGWQLAQGRCLGRSAAALGIAGGNGRNSDFTKAAGIDTSGACILKTGAFGSCAAGLWGQHLGSVC